MAFLILPYGCEKDEEIAISTKAKFNAPSITQAKQYVERHTTLNLKEPNNFLQSRDLQSSLTVDWDLSKTKKYKDEPEQQVDILYTPIYINNDAQAKMFVGSVEYNGDIESNIFCLIYTDLENTTTFSGYILRFDLNGALLEARKYQNGSLISPQDNTSEGMGRNNCDPETIFDMLILLLDGGESLSNWHGCLDTVVVYGSTTSIDAGDSANGGSPFDTAMVTSFNIPALETNSNNPSGGLSVPYWYTASVTANGFNISQWLEIHPLTPIAQWLMTEATTDQLQQIANFLNDHRYRIRDEHPNLDGFDPSNSPTTSTGYAIDETAIGHTINVSTSGANGTLLTMFPFVKYPLNSNYATLYPKLTAYLTNKLPNLKNDTFLMNALKTYGSLNDYQIEEALTWGTGTTIEVTNMPCCWAAYGPNWGFDTNTIVLSTDLVNLIENNTTIDTDVLDFFIAIVILHEHTHLGDFLYNGGMYDGEEGDDFEMAVTGTSQLNPENFNIAYQNYLILKNE